MILEILELEAILDEVQELLKHSAYAVVGKHGEVIYEKFPVSLQNEDDRVTFEAIKNKFDYSKKHRQTLKKFKDEVKPSKPTYTDDSTLLYQTRSGLSQVNENVIKVLLDLYNDDNLEQ